MCQAADARVSMAPAHWMTAHIQQTLSTMNRRRLTPATPAVNVMAQWMQDQEDNLTEHRFLEDERAAVAAEAAHSPRDPLAFAAWFDRLQIDGPGQFDPLFDFLATQATWAQMSWFMYQEVAGEAGFEDLVALTQLRMPQQAKLELARNYWDEMGHGKPAAMHGPMLTKLAQALGIDEVDPREVVPESLALSNVLVGLAYNRRFAYHAVGALGVIELTAPTRAVKVVEALDRLGVDRAASHYFRVHAVVDIAHARTWRDEVIVPLVRAQPEVAVHIAEGALMRLRAGARTFDRYRREFGVTSSAAVA